MHKTDSLLESGLRKARLLMVCLHLNLVNRLDLQQSLFTQSNCQSPFAVRLFSLSSSPMRTSSLNADTPQQQSIICLRVFVSCRQFLCISTSDKRRLRIHAPGCYRDQGTIASSQTKVVTIKLNNQFDVVAYRIEETAPEVPIRDY